MPDPRFFTTEPGLTAADIAAAVKGKIIGGMPTIPVTHVADYNAPASCSSGSVVYVEALDGAGTLDGVSAAVCIVSDKGADDLPVSSDRVLITVPSPRAAFATIAAMLHGSLMEIAPSAALPATPPRIAPDTLIHDRATLYPGCDIKKGVRIAAGAVIGPGVVIGEQSHIGANACISHAILGARCRVFAGAVIGEAGFGHIMEEGNRPVPQLGRVMVGDDVDIGASTTIDRGTLGDTVIGDRTKIDNQVQVGHNVRIGRGCILAARVGISGSTVLEDNVVFAGRSAVADHLRIGKGAVILAGSGVTKSVASGETWFGYPARPAQEWRRREAGLNRLLKTNSNQKRKGAQ